MQTLVAVFGWIAVVMMLFALLLTPAVAISRMRKGDEHPTDIGCFTTVSTLARLFILITLILLLLY